jgi:signal transduction histidine kinase
MTALLDGVLTIGRLDSDRVDFNPYPLDLYRFFGEVVDEFRGTHSSTHRVTFNKNGSGDCAAFNGDEKLLRQILTNLLSNAIKYSPEGSTIQVVLTCEDGQDVVLSVTDQGIGIGEDDLQQLFEPFHRGDNVGNIKGTGLGLAIVKRAVECHGGSIVCASVINQGSTFTVRLPQTQPKGERNE